MCIEECTASPDSSIMAVDRNRIGKRNGSEKAGRTAALNAGLLAAGVRAILVFTVAGLANRYLLSAAIAIILASRVAHSCPTNGVRTILFSTATV